MKKHFFLSLCGIVFMLCLSLWARGQTSITINGPDTACVISAGTYQVNSPTSNVVYTWSTTLGSVQGTPIGTIANILWGNTSGTATITVNGYDQSNALVETGTKNVELVSVPLPSITTNYRVACIGSYIGNDTNSVGEPIPDTLFLDDKYSCPKVCENALVQYDVQGSGGQYKWTVTGGTIQGSSTSSTVYILWGSAGSGSIKVEEYYGACTVSKTICIDIIAKPVAAFSVLPDTDPVEDCDTFDVCLDAKVAFKDLSTGSANSQIVSWYWDFGDNTSSGQQNPPSHKYNGAGVYKVQLVVTNECGCVDTFCAHINVYQDPGPEILCQAVACENDSVEYCTNAIGCNAYNWTAVGGTIVTNNDTCIKVVWDQLGDNDNFGYISLGVDCNGLCSANTTIKVPVVKANPNITGPDKLCVGVEYKFTVPLWPGTEYNWGVLNNSGAVVNGRKSNEVVLKFTSSGTYDVHVTWKNHISICGGDTTFQVTVMDNDTIVGSNVGCKGGQSQVYTMSSTNSADWKLTDPTGSVVTTSSGTSFNTSFSMAGMYKLEATNYCADPLFINVTEITDIIDSIVGDDTVCLNKPYTYRAYSAAPGRVVKWAVIDGTIVGSDIGNTVTVVWTNSAGGQLAAYQKSVNYPYCEGQATVLDVFADQVNPNVTGPDSVCSDSYNDYSSNYYSPGATYTWRVDPHTVGNVQSGTYDPDIVFKANRVTSPTDAKIIVQVKKCGLTVEDTIEIVVMPQLLPHVYTSQDTFCNGELIEFTTDPGATYLWHFADQNVRITDTPYVTHEYWFKWSDTLFGHSPTGVRQYYVRVKASGTDPDFPMQCPPGGESGKYIYVKPGPVVVDSVFGTTAYPCGGTISTLMKAHDTLCTGTPQYQWYVMGTLVSTPNAISGATSQYYTATAAGYYFCIVTDPNTGCRGKGNIIHITIAPCPTPGCNGLVVLNETANSCGSVTFSGTPTTGTFPVYKTPVISSAGAINSPINSNTGTLEFLTAGYHTVKYSMQVEQSPFVFCLKDTFITTEVPLVANYKMDVQCGTGQYDISLVDISSYIDLPGRYLETTWDIATDFAMTNIVQTSGGYITTPYLLSPTLSGGIYYIRQITRLRDGTATPVATCTRKHSVTFPTWPTVDIDYDPTSICEGLPIFFEADITPASTVVSSYLWDFGDATFSAVDPTYRVYAYQALTPPDTKIPQLTIVDEYGCTHVSPTGSIDIWPNDLGEGISGGTTVCNGPVTLTYSGPTTPTRYMWSDVGIFTANTTHPVNTSGSYFVTIEDANSCRYVTNPQDVTIINPVNTGITGRTAYCLGEEIFLSAYAGDSPNLTYSWERNTTSVGGNDPYLFDAGLGRGTYNYDLEIIYNDGVTSCTTNLGPVVVSIDTPSAPPTITALNVLDCQKYELELVGSAPGAGTLLWANGPAGTNYTIYSGGAYRLYFYNSFGCVSFDDTLVPPSPESMFGWFPDGCYELCSDQFPFWLYGPPGDWDFWEWKAAGGAASSLSGTNSAVSPYQVTAADDYTLELDNGLCSQVSEVMSVTSKSCSPCADIYVDIQLFCDPDNPGGYTLVLDLNNPSPADMDVLVAFGSGPIKPFKLHLPNGAHQFNLYGVTMQGPPDTLEISYTVRGRKCFFRKFIDPSKYTYPCTNWPSQKPGKNPATVSQALADDGRVQTAMLVFPNPASNTMTVNYNYGGQGEGRRRLVVYDMMGRRMAEVPVSEYNASHSMNVAGWTQGVYIVRMEEDGRAIHSLRVTITH